MKNYTLEEFQKLVPMYVDSVMEGFGEYPSVVLDGDNIDLVTVITSLTEQTGYEQCYADCYYYRIPQEAREKLKMHYSADEIAVIETSGLTKEKYFVQLDSALLSVLLRISMDEMLFSTFYYPTLGIMIWSNYEKQFPVFFASEQEKEKFLNKWI